MKRLTLFVLACAVLCCGLLGTARAQKRESTTANLEQRVAELERQLTSILKELHGLRRILSKQTDFVVHRLKSADAVKVAQSLTAMLGEKSVRIVADPLTNTVLVQAEPAKAKEIAEILRRLDELSK